jgi:DNA-binding transcriptional MerR regulator
MKTKASAQRSRTFAIEPDEPVYVIGVVSQLIGLPVWTLRVLDREGVVKAARRDGRARLYCYNDLQRLVKIRQLIVEEQVNVHGVRVILRMERGEILG